jgi:hypothetical protein
MSWDWDDVSSSYGSTDEDHLEPSSYESAVKPTCREKQLRR